MEQTAVEPAGRISHGRQGPRPEAEELLKVLAGHRGHAAFDEGAVTRFYGAAAAKGIRLARGDWFGEEARVFRLGFGLLSMAELGDGLGGLTAALKETATAGRRT